MNTHEYNPDVWWECALAYWVKAHNPEVELVQNREASEYFMWYEDDFKREDGSLPEAVKYMFAEQHTLEYQSFSCGVELTEYDPATPGGWGFWSAIFNSEDLKKAALESPDGMAYGKWDALRQVMNMGQISYMTKFNLAMAGFANGLDKEVKQVLGHIIYDNAKAQKKEEENVEENKD